MFSIEVTVGFHIPIFRSAVSLLLFFCLRVLFWSSAAGSAFVCYLFILLFAALLSLYAFIVPPTPPCGPHRVYASLCTAKQEIIKLNFSYYPNRGPTVRAYHYRAIREPLSRWDNEESLAAWLCHGLNQVTR